MDNLFQQKTINASEIIDYPFLNAKGMYLHAFNRAPSTSVIYQVDGEKAFPVLKEKFGSLTKHVYDYNRYDKKEKVYKFNKGMILFNNNCIVEVDDDTCEIHHDGTQKEFIDAVTSLVSDYKERVRRKPLEINLIVSSNDGLVLKGMEIKRTKLDLGLFYENDFKETDSIIRKRLNKKNDKGIVLLHGLPGTGKTTYLRYLVGKIKKRVLFLSPSVAGNLMNPDFIELLIKNPNSVLIIEDAENIIMDRKFDTGSAVSNLLNISDGLLADFLNVQIICTFNSSVAFIDNALMRKGRLIAKYEFGKLSAEKAQYLSNHFGFDATIKQPMTIAEVANQHEKEQPLNRVEVIGFRRSIIENQT